MTMIEVQETYIVRVARAYARQGKRSAGLMYARTVRAARKEANVVLRKMGYTDTQAEQIVRDAHDMVLLERSAI